MTRPLGVASPALPESAAGVAAPMPPAASVAEPDTCWRVQVAAPTELAKAMAMQRAARDLLLTPMTIVREAGLHKVRSEQCLPRAAAESLRARAVASGFDGVFLVRVTGAKP
jgi:hypothetical protein